ncbi:hypothetical protein SAMN04488540_11717 [Ferrimonas sediminum]|uniref:SMODS and SLOG-associating 2TM effector domain-containing protein n=1 Tax=Ferrimonas sediminum TaxID=718193 RepID=A0A1G8YAJ4_9GAMM|nr:SLATT domain-containing protein [Ferrimonas sediminum]SDJ99746.1 hypothetical protein SAMN04488540_11717 [Ferrimonas sediminum]
MLGKFLIWLWHFFFFPKKEDTLPEKCQVTDQSSLTQNWIDRLGDAQVGHYKCSERLYTYANWSGVALICSTTIVTASLFLHDFGGNPWVGKYIIPAISIIAAILSGVVSFVRFAERAELHRAAASRYGKLRRELDQIGILSNRLSPEEYSAKLEKLRLEWEYISADAPLTRRNAIPKRINSRSRDKTANLNLVHAGGLAENSDVSKRNA